MNKIILLFKYLFYMWLTSDERHLYSIGKIKGYNCLGMTEGLAGRTYKYDKASKPVRDYLTYKEFINKNSN